MLVADALKKLGVKSNIDPATLNKQVQAGLDRLYNYQHDDGGWGWWQTDDSHPFMTAYVLAGLSQAKAAGFDVKQDAIDKGRAWLCRSSTSRPRCEPTCVHTWPMLWCSVAATATRR